MKTWNSPSGPLKLARYPFEGQRSHQAWDSADEWIISRFPQHSDPVIVVGEAFGVLGTAWGAADVTAAGDSSLALTALEKNRKLNPSTTGGTLRILPSTDMKTATEAFSRIFIRLPKSLSLLEFYLENAVRFADENTEIWLGAMDKRWSSGVKKIAEHLLENVEVFPFEKHSRWLCFRKKAEPTTARATTAIEGWDLDEYPLTFSPAPDVFSSSDLDAGTAAFLRAFPEKIIKDASAIADLGCGSGIFGISASYLNREASVWFTDESYLAAGNAEKNYKLNKLEGKASFLVTNGLDGIPDNSVDLVLCNPPFHFQNIQSREPAAFMFAEALRVLTPGGCIQIVGNSHLGYHKLLDEYFDRIKEVYRDRKFTVLRAEKR